MNTKLHAAYTEYVAELALHRAEDVAEANVDDRDAADWNASCRAMENAESNHFERFAPHAADTENEERMGWT